MTQAGKVIAVTDTPLCDKQQYPIGPEDYAVPANFARTLERQLAAAIARLEAAEKDAARYRWLRGFERVKIQSADYEDNEAILTSTMYDSEELDKSIDEMMGSAAIDAAQGSKP